MLLRYRFHLIDVFTDRAFGGNQLAVLPAATGLSDATMQSIAREFNFSETTFVLPPADPANSHKVRIFTPQAEIPFAGHPNVGTAFALVAAGEVKAQGVSVTLRFEENAGLVPVIVSLVDGKPVRAELTAPQAPRLGETLPVSVVAQALGLHEGDVVAGRHPPCISSAGMGLLCVEVRNRDALARARAVPSLAEPLLPRATVAGFYVYTHDGGESGIDLRARMFAPTHGIVEDPATGGGAAALAGLLALVDQRADASLQWRIGQGVSKWAGPACWKPRQSRRAAW
ncbi:MAG: PhzF family phenazine biosynthesis protein [Gammaproteobacteria bacterium]